MKKLKISFEEQEIIKFLDNYELSIFTYNMLREDKNLSEIQYLQSCLESLVSKGLLSRIEKGKYCRHNFRNEFVISNYLASDGIVAYWSALNLHGLTEQFPNTVFVQTSKQKRHKTVFGLRYRFIKVKPQKMTGIIQEGYGNHQYRITDIEKTIVDCFDLPQYSGGFTELLRAFATADLNSQKMIEYCKAIDNTAATKRMAYLSNLIGKPKMGPFLDYAKSVVNERYSLFDALGIDEGAFVKRWRIRLNISEEDILYLIDKQY